MTRTLLSLSFALAAGCGLAHAAETAPLAPFHADYDVLRNGKVMGKASLDLHPATGDTWEFVNQTHGTSGMAALAGIDVREVSTFHWRHGLPESLQYQFTQKSALKNKQRGIVFDLSKNSAASHDGDQHWDVALQPGSIDRNLVVLAIAADLKRGSKTLSYPVLDKDAVEVKQYAAGATGSLDLPAGKIDAVEVKRERQDNSNKQNTSWFAAARGFLPVQLEQQDKNDTVTLRLVSLQNNASAH